MWRSFLDKAIPRYNGNNWRKNIEQAMASTAKLPLPANSPPDLSSNQPTLPTSMPSAPLQQAPMEKEEPPSNLPPDSIANSLQILSKLDPSVIQLLNSLNSKFNPNTVSTNVPAAPVANQQPHLNSPVEVGGLPQADLGLSNSPGLYGESEYTTNMPQYGMQYGLNGEQMQYLQMPVDQAGQPNYAAMPQYQQQPYMYEQYQDGQSGQQEGIDPSTYYQTPPNGNIHGQMQYEYIESGQDAATTIVPGEEGDINEISENQPDRQPNESEETDQEEESDKEVAEDKRRNMPHVIIGPPIGAARGKRARRKKLLASESLVQLPKRRKKRRRMFGKPRVISKRMLNLEPISKKLQKTKRLFSRRIFASTSQRSSTTTRRPNMWNTSGSSRMYRFVTPRYPIPLLHSQIRKNNFNRAGIERPTQIEARSSIDTKMDHISIAMSNNTRKTVKLKSKKIRLVELDEVKPNCTAKEVSKAKGNFSVVWSQKSGWPKSCNSTEGVNTIETVQINLSTGIKSNSAVTVSNNVTRETTTTMPTSASSEMTTEPSIPTTTTMESPKSVPTEVPKVVSTDATICTTATANTFVQSTTFNNNDSQAIPNSFIENFNKFMASLTTPAPSTTTTTTTMAPSTTEMSNYQTPPMMTSTADELPKEFLYHVLMAINASKIDDYQIHNKWSNTNGNNFASAGNMIKVTLLSANSILIHKVNTLNTKSNEADLETEEEDVDDNQVDWKNEGDRGNRVDGKNPANHRFKRICYYLLNGGRDGQLDVSQLEPHICSHLIVGYARVSTNGLVEVEKPLEDSEKYTTNKINNSN